MSLWWVLPVLGGACLPLQAGINGQLGRELNSALAAAWVSFLVGTLALTVVLWSRSELPAPSDLLRVQPSLFLGGVLGVVFIATAAASAPRLDAVLLMSLILAGQVIAALTLDQFGLAGYAQHSLNLTRLAGLALLLGGVALIRAG